MATTTPPSAIPEDGGKSLPVGLTPVEQANLLFDWIGQAIQYSNRKRFGFRTASSALKIATLSLSAASTIILGVQDLDFWTGLGFALVALATVVGAVEPFFNWRSRWVLMEEQLSRFHRLRDDLAMRLASSPVDAVTRELVAEHYTTYREIWSSSSQRWLEFRKTEQEG
jgi:hypothetical protein